MAARSVAAFAPRASAPRDALVIGAGPAGTAAARMLALHGARVVLADRHAFPRDKVCGDALIPDALAALGELGVLDDVLAVSRRVSGCSSKGC